jgi:16S rRNA U1498 N3-methylase RsmE
VLRFYVADTIELKHNFWVHDEQLLGRWRDELQLQAGQEVVLFDGRREDRLYKILEITDREAHVQYVTDYARKLPNREVYFVWAPEDNGTAESIVRAGVHGGISHFIPYYDEGQVPERPRLDVGTLRHIAVTETEQSERSDVPVVREPMTLAAILDELRSKTMVIAGDFTAGSALPDIKEGQGVTLLLPPLGGWQGAERELLRDLEHFDLGDTVRNLDAIIGEVVQRFDIHLVD